jgi:hypothetical protein
MQWQTVKEGKLKDRWEPRNCFIRTGIKQQEPFRDHLNKSTIGTNSTFSNNGEHLVLDRCDHDG